MSSRYFKKINKKGGYTIIETMIAISLFLVIIISGMGVFLNANLLHQKSQNMRSIMDNMSFVMEDMSRNLRTGYDYVCSDVPGSVIMSPRQSCESGWAVAFKPENYSAANPDQWVYYIGADTSLPNNPLAIWRSTNSGTSYVKLTPDEVVMSLDYGFSILGAESVATDSQQPFITIKLVGSITYKNVVTPFSLQSSVSQRLIDI